MLTNPPPSEDANGDALRLYRRAVLCYPLLLVAYYLAPIFPTLDSAFLADDAYGVASYSYAGALLPLPPLTGLLLIAVELAALVGLYALFAHARTLFLLLCIFNVVQLLVSGMWVASPVSAVLAYALNLLQGGILLLAYSQPMSQRFQ